jgi:hypothetical protein
MRVKRTDVVIALETGPAMGVDTVRDAALPLVVSS